MKKETKEMETQIQQDFRQQVDNRHSFDVNFASNVIDTQLRDPLSFNRNSSKKFPSDDGLQMPSADRQLVIKIFNKTISTSLQPVSPRRRVACRRLQ